MPTEVTNEGWGIDKSILPLIKVLNKLGMRTQASCMDVNSMNKHDQGLGAQWYNDQPSKYWYTAGFISFYVTDWEKFNNAMKGFAVKYKPRTMYANGYASISISPSYTITGNYRWDGTLRFTVNTCDTQAEVQKLHYELIKSLIQYFTRILKGEIVPRAPSKNTVIVRWNRTKGRSSGRMLKEAQVDEATITHIEKDWLRTRPSIPYQTIGLYRDGKFQYYFRQMKNEDDLWEEE